ncbi:hypothetical protein BDQ17DRAFT_1430820 [Cyathus striatus]|nr:hypothetical protein BDQ17DRAFT_1430820 [Cyathus striatus]
MTRSEARRGTTSTRRSRFVSSPAKKNHVPDASTSSGNAIANSSKRVAGSTSLQMEKRVCRRETVKAAVKKEIDTEMPDASVLVTICADRKPVPSRILPWAAFPISREIDAFLSTVKVDLSTYPTQRNPTASSSIMKVKKEQDMTPTIKKEIDEPMIDAPSSKVDSARQERSLFWVEFQGLKWLPYKPLHRKSGCVGYAHQAHQLRSTSSKGEGAYISGVGPTTAAKNVMNALDAPPSSSKNRVTTAAKNVQLGWINASPFAESEFYDAGEKPMLARIPKIPKIQNVVLNSQVENHITTALRKGEVDSVDVSLRKKLDLLIPRTDRMQSVLLPAHPGQLAMWRVLWVPSKGSNTQGMLGNTTTFQLAYFNQRRNQLHTPHNQGLDHHTLFEYIHKISRSVWKQHFHKAHFWVLIGDDKGSNKDAFTLAKSEFVVDVLMSVLDDEEEVEEVDFVAIPATMSVPRNLSYKVPHPILVTGASARLTKELVEGGTLILSGGGGLFPAHCPLRGL